MSQLSYKKKSWCVLMDGQLLIYARDTDIKPKEVLQLKACYFDIAEEVVSVCSYDVVHIHAVQWACRQLTG